VVAQQEALSPQDELKRFSLPPGFEIQLVASEPDIIKPMNLAFDDRGRLLCTQSVEYPFPAKDPAAARDTVKVLENFGPDGKAGKISTYVSGLNIPIGVYPTADGVICYSIPKIWKYSDADNDGVCEKREPLYGDIGTRDTHGMTNAFTPWIDGWWYACHGFSNDSTLKSASTDSQIKMHSGNTYRFRPDGTKVEYYTHGQVNPFGLCFDPLGNLYSADCHSLPIYELLRNGWYPTFDGLNDGLGNAPNIMSHLHGSTAIGGIVWYAATQFPEPYRETVFVGNPVTGRIDLDKLEKHGSSFKAIEQPDFLRSDDRWFRPVDLKLAPDGSIYVADFYNRIIGHYEVPLTHPGRDHERGRIWRIVYKGDGAAVKSMPDLTKLGAADLVALLKDDNLQVRVRATNQLADRIGKAGLDEVRKALDGTPTQKAHCLWVLERLGVLDEGIVRKLAADADRLVRVHVLKALGERPAWTFEGDLVRGMLQDADAFARRAAAEALGLHPANGNIKPLIELWASAPKDDTHLIHMARMTLRDQLVPAGAFAALPALLGNDKAALGRVANVCVGVKTEESGSFALAWMQSEKLDGAAIAGFLKHVIRYGPLESMGSAFALASGMSSRPPREQLGLVRSVSQGCQERGYKTPEAFAPWARGTVSAALAVEDKGVVQEALKLCREVKIDGVYDEVEALALRGKHQDLRAAAIDALPQLDAKRTIATLGKIIATPDENANLRLKAVQSLAGMNRPDARDELLAQLKTASHATAVAIAAGLAQTNEGADKLLAAVGEGKASPRLLADKAVDGRLRAGKPKELIARLDKIQKDLPPEDDRINKLIAARKAGYGASKPSAAHGAELFAKTCAGCHRLDGKGQKVGPELDGVWGRGVERLLEDVLDPNRNVDQAFRATLIKTTDGRVLSGLVLREEGAVLVVQEAVDKETRVPLKDIDQRVLSQLSPMPQNVTEPLSEPDFYDLMSYLLQPRSTQK
ncbi:MAG TPA: PVC-type heme-binding CxxCH protein, partial [Planctomycetota bacterium]|nr:PVC-type heme-binding CxxCH protein [Planctomycetota bacterium]